MIGGVDVRIFFCLVINCVIDVVCVVLCGGGMWMRDVVCDDKDYVFLNVLCVVVWMCVCVEGEEEIFCNLVIDFGVFFLFYVVFFLRMACRIISMLIFWLGCLIFLIMMLLWISLWNLWVKIVMFCLGFKILSWCVSTRASARVRV